MLREGLAGLEPRGVARGTEDCEPFGGEDVDEPLLEGRFGPDDGEVDRLVAGELEEPSESVAAIGKHRASGGDAGVARGTDDLGDGRSAAKLPRQGVLTPARPDDENLHGAPLAQAARAQWSRVDGVSPEMLDCFAVAIAREQARLHEHPGVFFRERQFYPVQPVMGGAVAWLK